MSVPRIFKITCRASAVESFPGLVIGNPKAKQKFETALKRTLYESIPMPKLKKSKLTDGVGVVSEAKCLATSISIPRQASDAPKIQTSEVQRKDTHHAQIH